VGASHPIKQREHCVNRGKKSGGGSQDDSSSVRGGEGGSSRRKKSDLLECAVKPLHEGKKRGGGQARESCLVNKKLSRASPEESGGKGANHQLPF